jgi:hypothetical protein
VVVSNESFTALNNEYELSVVVSLSVFESTIPDTTAVATTAPKLKYVAEDDDRPSYPCCCCC